jgi:hypothetical protein
MGMGYRAGAGGGSRDPGTQRPVGPGGSVGRNLDKRKGKARESARWRYRPAFSAAVGLAVVALPVALAVGVAVFIEVLVSEPASSIGRALWWIGVLGLSIVVLVVCAHVARRALTLSILLRIGLLFPGVAPKRAAVARRAASARDLGRRVDASRSEEVAGDSVVAAERIVELAARLSANDRKTRGHAERVRTLTELVADKLRLADPDRDRLRWAALLHDVAKLAVHPDFLNKQQDLVRRHPLEGPSLTAPLSDRPSDGASPIAAQHDGTEYLSGGAGDTSSLGGQIVAVVDAYDVMTSVQSYRGPILPDAARAKLARLAGSQFDPAVVRAFLAIPVRRLRCPPLARIASLRLGRDGPKLAVLGRIAAALIVVGSIVGLTSWRPWVAQQGVVALAARAGNADSPSSGALVPGAASGDKRGPSSRKRTNAGPSTKSRSGGRAANQRDRKGRVPGGGTATSSGGKQNSLTGFPALLIGFPWLFAGVPTTTTTSPGPGSNSPPLPTTTTAPPPTTTTTAPPPTTTTTPVPPTTTPTTSPSPPTTTPTPPTTTPTTTP